jgi:hypothetical protein
MTLTDLVNAIYIDIEGHQTECDCNLCLTMDMVQEYMSRFHIDSLDGGMVE